jgi:hypothetical protein
MAGTGDFHFERRPGGTVLISRRGRRVTVLRGARADRFAAEAAGGDPQLVMARWTGDYRRGNERAARDHPRDRGR